jgi:hypothetical protein
MKYIQHRRSLKRWPWTIIREPSQEQELALKPSTVFAMHDNMPSSLPSSGHEAMTATRQQ